jgi:hypothetical protein
VWIAWIQDNATTGDDEVMMSRMNAFGQVTYGPFVVSSSVQSITDVSLAVDTGNPTIAYVAWSDSSDDMGALVQPRLFIAKYMNSIEQWTVEQSTVTGSAKLGAKMVIVSFDVIVAWVDLRTGNSDIYAQRLSATDGSSVWDEVAVATGSGNQQNISMTTGSGGNDIYASRVNSLLQEIWVQGGVKVASDGTGVQLGLPSVIGAGGGAYVSYSSTASGGESRLLTSYIAPNTSADPAAGFPTASAGEVTITDHAAELVPTTDGIVAIWRGAKTLDTNPNKLFAQVFSGQVQSSRIQTPTAVSPSGGGGAFGALFALILIGIGALRRRVIAIGH